MLIKKRKLVGINGKNITRILQPEHGEISKALQLEIQKAKEEARKIKHEAHVVLTESEQKFKEALIKAKEIISNANLEAKTIKEKVYQDTLKAANEEAALIKEQAKMVLKELFEVKREALTQANKEIIKVALDLAEKIIRYKVSVDSNILQTQVVDAIKKATSEADRVQVFVNPSDLKTLEENIPQMEKLFPSGVNIIALANDSVDPGSCIVETKSGQLDARFSTQLQALTDLISHIEVIEPQIEINEETSAVTTEVQESSFLEVEQGEVPAVVEEHEDELGESEKTILEKELLSNNEESFPFISTEQLISPALPLELEDEESIIEEEDLQEQEIINIPEEIVQNIEKQLLEKEQPQVNIQQKKKLNIGHIPERTREEAEELDEDLVFEHEEDQLEEEKEEIKPQNILKPKKSKSSEVSDIASELEEDSEWKDLVEEDE